MKKGVKIKDTTGKPFSLRTVFKESISFFKKHALDAITRKTTVLSSDVLWVLTIPAIWSEPAKQFMRTAAEEVHVTKKKQNDLFSFYIFYYTIHLKLQFIQLFYRKKNIGQNSNRQNTKRYV